MTDENYDALVDALYDVEPDPYTGVVERCGIKIALAEFGIAPFRMASTIIEDRTRDREIELRRAISTK